MRGFESLPLRPKRFSRCRGCRCRPSAKRHLFGFPRAGRESQTAGPGFPKRSMGPGGDAARPTTCCTSFAEVRTSSLSGRALFERRGRLDLDKLSRRSLSTPRPTDAGLARAAHLTNPGQRHPAPKSLRQRGSHRAQLGDGYFLPLANQPKTASPIRTRRSPSQTLKVSARMIPTSTRTPPIAMPRRSRARAGKPLLFGGAP